MKLQTTGALWRPVARPPISGRPNPNRDGKYAAATLSTLELRRLVAEMVG